MEQNEKLQHHGIKGMKWGVRKQEKLKQKYKTQTEKMAEIRKTKGVQSDKFRKIAKDRYVTKTKIDYQDAKNRKDKVDKYYAKNEVKFAKHLKKNGTFGYFKSVTKPIYGHNLTKKENDTIDMYEAKQKRRKEIGRKASKTALSVIGTTSVVALPIMAQKGMLNFTWKGTHYIFK